jgi:carbon monoxide dehydrogenase subunit G
MIIDNAFEISLPVEQAWKVLLDVPAIAPCMPGAELLEIEGNNSYRGKVSVKLGPVALAFTGRARIEGVDEANHKATINAQGLDSKGRGGATAIVHFEILPTDAGSKVSIKTDLTLSGAVAQYGRGAGIIKEVANQLIGQFARSLEAQLAGGAEGQAVPAGDAKPISGLSLVSRSIWASLKKSPEKND